MQLPTLTRCPYTRKALSEVDQSVEHIVPDALGGGGGLSVMADRKPNNDLGTSLDQELVTSPLLGLMRVSLGIKTYRGSPKLKLPGKVKGHAVPIEVTFTETGASTKVEKPVQMDPDGKSGRMIVPADREAEFVNRLIADHARKGNVVRLEDATSLGADMELDFGFDVLQIRRGMAKIAFLAAFRVLGDAFLNDPLYPEWHKAIFSTDRDEVMGAKIHGVAFDSSDLLQVAAPRVQQHEHAVVVANLGMSGPVVMVSLFGGGFHNLIAVASESNQYGLRQGFGEITICDAKQTKIRSIDYTDFLVARSEDKM
jgi:hypothetical protein